MPYHYGHGKDKKRKNKPKKSKMAKKSAIEKNKRETYIVPRFGFPRVALIISRFSFYTIFSNLWYGSKPHPQ